jgi:hypothetical protein
VTYQVSQLAAVVKEIQKLKETEITITADHSGKVTFGLSNDGEIVLYSIPAPGSSALDPVKRIGEKIKVDDQANTKAGP